MNRKLAGVAHCKYRILNIPCCTCKRTVPSILLHSTDGVAVSSKEVTLSLFMETALQSRALEWRYFYSLDLSLRASIKYPLVAILKSLDRVQKSTNRIVNVNIVHFILRGLNFVEEPGIGGICPPPTHERTVTLMLFGTWICFEHKEHFFKRNTRSTP